MKPINEPISVKKPDESIIEDALLFLVVLAMVLLPFWLMVE